MCNLLNTSIEIKPLQIDLLSNYKHHQQCNFYIASLLLFQRSMCQIQLPVLVEHMYLNGMWLGEAPRTDITKKNSLV